MLIAIKTNGLPSSLSSLRPPPKIVAHRAILASIEIAPARTATMELMRISLFFT